MNTVSVKIPVRVRVRFRVRVRVRVRVMVDAALGRRDVVAVVIAVLRCVSALLPHTTYRVLRTASTAYHLPRAYRYCYLYLYCYPYRYPYPYP